ncbi:MAG: NB-ARC domain-containing protein, partial [Anaerolineales bacterium]|nr:NB-ARC domain-containing protein [Anaerolineales bacterium]
MLDLTQTLLGFPLWSWMIGLGAIILCVIFFGRKSELEGINFTWMPPFVWFRTRHKSAPSPKPPEVPPPAARSVGDIATGGGDAQIAQGDGARQIQTRGAPYIEHAETVNLALPERPPRGSAAPPTRTAHYVRRGEIENKVRVALQARANVAVVGVAGMGGIGKTELAKHLCGELDGAQRVIWVGVYNRTLGDLQGELARALGIGTFPPNSTDESRYEILRAAFHDSPCVVFFDDVYKSAIPALKFLLPPSPPCAALITSRQRELGVARVFELDVMTEAQALELLREAHSLGDVIAREDDAARELCHLCGYLPLALDIAASRLRKQLHFSATPIAAFNQSLANRLKELQRGAQPSREDSVNVNI